MPPEESPASSGRRRGAALPVQEEQQRIREGGGRRQARHAAVVLPEAPEESPPTASPSPEEPDTGDDASSAAAEPGGPAAANDDPWLEPGDAEPDDDPWLLDDDVAASDVVGIDEPPAGRSAPAGAGPFRAELNGLRAVAILMVVTYHIWFGRVSGGVDIFLLISAFLLTGSFARKLEEGRPLRVARYWLHAFKRLVPPSALVILATLAGSLLLLPATRWLDSLDDSLASLGYAENWLLALRNVDYYAEGHAVGSPFQHFWSLSIQGQVFLAWPIVFALAGMVARVTRLPVRATLAVVFGAITLASFAWSVHLTATHQAFAYFDTRTRLWEFSLGSLLALALPSLERRLGYRQSSDPTQGRARTARALAAWAGLVLVLACGWVIDVHGAFPGWIALWPLLSASVVIAAGPTGTRWGADRLLAGRPLQWIGDISYALYLVHWPLLVLTLVAMGASRLDAVQGLAVIAVAVALAWLLTRLVDFPIRRSSRLEARWWRGALVITTSAALVVTAVVTTRTVLDARIHAIEADAELNNPGARSLAAGYVDEAAPDAKPLPDLAYLPDDWFAAGEACSGRLLPPGPASAVCTQQGPGTGKVLVIVGSSRDQQLAPAIAGTARAHGWTVVTIFAASCPYSRGVLDAWCDDHNREVTDYLLTVRPDAVASASSFVGSDHREKPMPGYDDFAREFLGAGIDLIGWRDVPRLSSNPVSCIAADPTDATGSSACRISIPHMYLPADPIPADAIAATADEPGAGTFVSIDLTGEICPSDVCVPEIGNVYVWLDERHITATYARTLAPALEAQLSERGWTW